MIEKTLKTDQITDISTNPLVSIIVPVYNVENYVDRCVESLINQSYKNIQIVLIDDGSTDQSGKKCDEYAKKDSRIDVLHCENGGPGAARNIGIDNANGEFISFVDSDDFVCSEFIRLLVETALQEKSEVVVCRFVKGNKNYYSFQDEKKACIELSKNKEFALQNWHGKYRDIETIPCNKLFKASLFNQGIRFPERRFFEDVITTHCLVQEANHVTYLKNELYYYYQRTDSTMHSISDSKIVDLIEMQEQRVEWFRESPYREATNRLEMKLLKYYMLYYVKSKDESLSQGNYNKFVLLKEKIAGKYTVVNHVIVILFSVFHKMLRSIYQGLFV